MKVLARHCFNCVHCEWNRAYESCALKTKNRIVYNGKREAANCNRYKQKEAGGVE